MPTEEEEELKASLEGLAAAKEIAPAPDTPRSARLNSAPQGAGDRRGSTAAKLKWRGALQAHVIATKFAQRVHESEGSDALLFRHVPAWIRYRRIEGFRYRLVTAIVDPVDAADSMHSGATFLGFPGASGWADKIGSVALHYRGTDWFVFSKILPFPEQRGEIDEHEDMLLLGAAKHVMMVPDHADPNPSPSPTPGPSPTPSPTPTPSPSPSPNPHQVPECIYRAPEPLGVGTSRVTTIKCMGLSARHTVVARLSPFVLRRGYLAWGHPQTGFAERVAACSQVSAEELERRMGAWWRRLLARVRCLVDQAFGLLQVEERLSRYPHDPLEPQYYESLLACANHQDPAEERARALMRARADPAGGTAAGASFDC